MSFIPNYLCLIRGLFVVPIFGKNIENAYRIRYKPIRTNSVDLDFIVSLQGEIGLAPLWGMGEECHFVVQISGKSVENVSKLIILTKNPHIEIS